MNYNFLVPKTIVLKNTLSATAADLVIDDAGSRTGPFQVPYGTTAYRSANIIIQFYKEKTIQLLAAGDTMKITVFSSDELAYYESLAAYIPGLALYLVEVSASTLTLLAEAVVKVTSAASGGTGTYTYAWTAVQDDTYIALTNATTATVTITASDTKTGTATVTCTATDSTTGETVTDVITVTVAAS